MRRIVLTLIGFLLGGCVPVGYDYLYISFEGLSEAKVMKQGVADIQNLESHDQMPVSYQISRGAYKLTINTDSKSKRPASFVSVEGVDGQPLTLKGLSVSDCGGFDYLTFDSKSSDSLRYEWWGFVKKQCINRNIRADEMKVVFRVLDGNIELAKERLPFELIKNGVYYEYDAL